jgi:hypothetical protein
MLKKLDLEDLSQLIIGASVLSVPIAFISLYAFRGIYQGQVKNRIATYLSLFLLPWVQLLLTVSIKSKSSAIFFSN